MTSPSRVVLADDRMAVREALRMLFEEEANLEVVGEAEDGREAVKLALERSPDIVLMDVSMPVMDGIEATRRIPPLQPQEIVISGWPEEGTRTLPVPRRQSTGCPRTRQEAPCVAPGARRPSETRAGPGCRS